jgi:hypothetical protein
MTFSEVMEWMHDHFLAAILITILLNGLIFGAVGYFIWALVTKVTGH